jgi:hypothetical protein
MLEKNRRLALGLKRFNGGGGSFYNAKVIACFKGVRHKRGKTIKLIKGFCNLIRLEHWIAAANAMNTV